MKSMKRGYPRTNAPSQTKAKRDGRFCKCVFGGSYTYACSFSPFVVANRIHYALGSLLWQFVSKLKPARLSYEFSNRSLKEALTPQPHTPAGTRRGPDCWLLHLFYRHQRQGSSAGAGFAKHSYFELRQCCL